MNSEKIVIDLVGAKDADDAVQMLEERLRNITVEVPFNVYIDLVDRAKPLPFRGHYTAEVVDDALVTNYEPPPTPPGPEESTPDRIRRLYKKYKDQGDNDRACVNKISACLAAVKRNTSAEEIRRILGISLIPDSHTPPKSTKPQQEGCPPPQPITKHRSLGWVRAHIIELASEAKTPAEIFTAVFSWVESAGEVHRIIAEEQARIDKAVRMFNAPEKKAYIKDLAAMFDREAEAAK